MVRVDAQGQQQRIVRNLHDPRGGESIAHLVDYPHQVNTLRQALKQGRDGSTHVTLPSSQSGLLALAARSQPSGPNPPRTWAFGRQQWQSEVWGPTKEPGGSRRKPP